LKVYNIHAKPDDVEQELSHLEQMISNEGNLMVLGDLNADCNYYNPEDKGFDGWEWVITDEEDTTSSATDCAYDRIILNADAYQEYVSHGVFKEGITKEISDHYLVWVELRVD
jgi:endonuclease/exonuclease/phosphatase family metal-dependent hydrolase